MVGVLTLTLTSFFRHELAPGYDAEASASIVGVRCNVNPVDERTAVDFQPRHVFNVTARSRIDERPIEAEPVRVAMDDEHFSGVPDLIRATGAIRLEPFSASADVKAPSVERAGHTWAMPWSIVALLVIVWLARKAYMAIRQRRRALRVVPPAVREPSPVP